MIRYIILGFSDDCCIFPFTYYGITINECIISPTTAGPPTTAGSLTRWLDDSPWCATEVNDDGSLKEWKNCDESCSGNHISLEIITMNPSSEYSFK